MPFPDSLLLLCLRGHLPPLAPHSTLLLRKHVQIVNLPRSLPAPQVYSLAFHQTMLECTAHASDRGLLLLALWRGFAMLWDAALQARFAAQLGVMLVRKRWHDLGRARAAAAPAETLAAGAGRQHVPSRQTPSSLSGAMPSCPRTASAQPRRPPAHLPTHRQTLTSPSFTVPCRLPAVHLFSARLPLQVVFPAETVQQSRERQAALLTSERLLEQLGEERGRSRALEQVVWWCLVQCVF